MAINVPNYNRQFLEKIKSGEPVYNNAAEKYGVQIESLPASELTTVGTPYWRVIGVHHLTGLENMSNHHVFCDVLDEDGWRINGARLRLNQGNGSPVFAAIDKPTNEPGTNFPMFKEMRASVSVTWPSDASLPSETVTGLRIDHADEEVGNTWGHHSFYVVFQKAKIKDAEPPETGEQPDDTESPVPDAPLSLEETIALTGQPKIIPLNPRAMFYRIAKKHHLGERLTSEYDAEYQGKRYRAQIYEKGVLYAEVGDWRNVKFIPRIN